MKVLVLEPHTSGHHGPYLQWMTQGLVERGFDITIVTFPESFAQTSIRTLSRAVENQPGKSPRIISSQADTAFRVHSVGISGTTVREIAYWRLFRDWYKAHSSNVRPDIVYLPYLDYCLYAIALLGSPFGKCPWAGLAMRPSFHYHEVGVIAPQPSLAFLKKALFFRLLDNQYLRCLLTIDEPLVGYLANNRKAAGKVTFIPEPAELQDQPDSVAAKRQFGLPLDRKLVLVYGTITRRKGVIELVRAIAHPEFPPDVDVLLAGKVLNDVREALDEPWIRQLVNHGRLKLIDRFIESEEEPALFASADIVWLGYREHYSASGVLVQAVSANRPVVACEEGIIGWQTRRHQLGMVVNPTNTELVCNAIKSTIAVAPRATSNKNNPKQSVGGAISNAQEILARALTHFS